MACRVQTCVSVISSTASGSAITCSSVYDSCSQPWSNKQGGEAVKQGKGAGREGGGSLGNRRPSERESESNRRSSIQTK